AEARRFQKKVLREFERRGVHADEVSRKRLERLHGAAVEASQTFARNIRDEVRTFEVDPAELAGLPPDFLATHRPGAGGKVSITTKYPDLVPIMAYAESEPLRKNLMQALSDRGHPVNDAVLKRMLEVRAEYAAILGYESWADYQAQ